MARVRFFGEILPSVNFSYRLRVSAVGKAKVLALTVKDTYATLAAAQEAGASVFAYGQFVQNIIDFLIVAFCIFMMLKGINKLNRKKEEPAAPEEPKGPTQEELLAEIRDLLKKQ